MSPRSSQGRRPRPPAPARGLWSAAEREVTRVLLQCRDDETRLDVMIKATGQVRAGRVSRITAESVTLALEPPPPDLVFPHLALCFVSSHHEGRALVFVATVGEFVRGRGTSQPDELVLNLPEQIINEDVRTAFRVPIRSRSAVDARLVDKNGESCTVEPMNMSVSGMLFRFPRQTEQELEVGAEVELQLQGGDDPVRIRGVVRRAGGGSYGVFFPESLQNGVVDPPDELRRLVKELELDWLANRKR